MKIKILEDTPQIEVKYLTYIHDSYELVKYNDSCEHNEITGIIIRSAIFVDTSFLDEYPNLKYIFRVGVGLDKIDKKSCEERGIQVLNTPGANSDSVADLVLGGILNLSRKMQYGFRGLENRFKYMGSELSSKSVGIIGFGNIGKKIYTRLLAFGVKSFLIYDPFLKEEDIMGFEGCKKIENKNEIFSQSDIITFHIPLLESTKNFLGKQEIALLKKDAMIINTSRGGIIDENELITYLIENPCSSFFADVWEEEPSDPKIEFLELENCIITPHIGAMTEDANKKMHYFRELEEGSL